MIFSNPAGAPELACDDCGCRWFDRMGGSGLGAAVCYECGAPVTAAARAEFDAAVAVWARAGAARVPIAKT